MPGKLLDSRLRTNDEALRFHKERDRARSSVTRTQLPGGNDDFIEDRLIAGDEGEQSLKQTCGSCKAQWDTKCGRPRYIHLVDVGMDIKVRRDPGIVGGLIDRTATHHRDTRLDGYGCRQLRRAKRRMRGGLHDLHEQARENQDQAEFRGSLTGNKPLRRGDLVR